MVGTRPVEPLRKIAVVGSRSWPSTEYWRIESLIDYYARTWRPAIVSGGALGPDSVAEKRALQRGLMVISYRPIKVQMRYLVYRYIMEPGKPADVLQMGEHKSFAEAAFGRNTMIVSEGDKVHAFWVPNPDPKRGGTRDSVHKALSMCKNIEVQFA